MDKASSTILSYLVEQHTQSLVANATEIQMLNEFQFKETLKQARQETYLRKLLIVRARVLLKEKVNNYIITLCDVYDGNFVDYPLNMDKDTTPEWMIANMILSMKSDREKNDFTDIFKFVYDTPPGLYFQ